MIPLLFPARAMAFDSEWPSHRFGLHDGLWGHNATTWVTRPLVADRYDVTREQRTVARSKATGARWPLSMPVLS